MRKWDCSLMASREIRMVIADNTAIINGLQVTEIKIDNLPNTRGLNMEATYALLRADPKTKTFLNTHGKCSANMSNWSKETRQLLDDLIESMENDLIPRHFEENNQSNITEETRDAKTRLESEQHEDPHQV